MPLRAGSITSLTIDPRRAGFLLSRPDGDVSTYFDLYSDDDGFAISQVEMLRRSALLALAQRALADGLFVSVYCDDFVPDVHDGSVFHPMPVHRVELGKVLDEDNDLGLKTLLEPVELMKGGLVINKKVPVP